jgi:superoxide dismutase, Fe-Mn family
MEQKKHSFKALSSTRRQFLGLTASTLGLVSLSTLYSPAFATAASFSKKETSMTKLILPSLPYDKDALAPAMSAETLDYHHGKHHQAYVDKGNELIEKAGLGNKTVEEIIIQSYGKPDQAPLFNNVAQHWNHNHFWNWMTKNGGGNKVPGSLEAPIKEAFGGFDQFREKFIADGMGQFGSGWVWLVSDDKGALSIMKTPNGENPLVHGKTAILGSDVWEHSYYIDYRNARQKYLEAFVDKLVNWDYVASLYEQVSKKAAA